MAFGWQKPLLSHRMCSSLHMQGTPTVALFCHNKDKLVTSFACKRQSSSRFPAKGERLDLSARARACSSALRDHSSWICGFRSSKLLCTRKAPF